MPYYEGTNLRTLPPRIGFGTPIIRTNTKPESIETKKHPDYLPNLPDWNKWRTCYEGGNQFVEDYLEQYSKREDNDAFSLRKKMAPTPTFASAAINDVKNSIFQRTTDITRSGGPRTYDDAVQGRSLGVDLQRSTMNWFIGSKVIPELLVMAKVGVFIDAPRANGPTKADKVGHPYLYVYRREDILNWSYDHDGELKAVLLRDYVEEVDSDTDLPVGIKKGFRLIYKTVTETGLPNITAKSFNEVGELKETVTLNIKVIPFVIFEISQSLMRGVCNHQIALLNLESSDIGFLLLANFPMYVEQVGDNYNAPHLRKNNNQTGTDPSCDLPQEDDENNIKVGVSHGRRYGKGLDSPDFIAPPTEPIKASMEKQKNLKDDIRRLINLNLSDVQAKMASAESKALDNQGLESGISNVGLELEHGERKIAAVWAAYEGSTSIAEIHYPKTYSLKSDEQRRSEAKELLLLKDSLPSLIAQREMCKQVTILLLGDKVLGPVLDKMLKEIDEAKVLDVQIDSLITMIENGLISTKLAAEVRGLPNSDLEVAVTEHLDRLKRIQDAQTSANPAARGNPDLDPNPRSGEQEKIGKPKRGEGE